MSKITDNLHSIQNRITQAAQASGRPADTVKLIAVTKYVDIPEIEELIAAGQRDFGESRPQDLQRKASALAQHAVNWHMIGHLQTNKVNQCLPWLTLLHALDRDRLVQATQDWSRQYQQTVPALIEVNISGDANKHGYRPEDLESLLLRLSQAPGGIQIRGLMGMSGVDSTPDQAQREFATLRELRDRLQQLALPGIDLTELSMGMSDDFELAIAQGSTLVRVGSALFE